MSLETSYGLGLDAGGTYTDAALLDLRDGSLVAARKAPTTAQQPAIGIDAALAQLESDRLERTALVSLATTFATNAIVEDRGANAGLILIGYDEIPPELAGDIPVLRVLGGHTVTGEEKAPLALADLERELDGFVAGLDAVAVTGFFAVRNPAHEIRVADLLRHRYDLPVVRGHRLSLRLDAMKRATTAWWNARLIPIIHRLIRDVQKVLEERCVQAPLMVVRGDGTLMSAETALERPVETLLSGPAASILGARHLGRAKDALIVDMGGTTTDMAALVDGRVALDREGARVGKWRTHVEAARVRTVGIGGDSFIRFSRDRRLQVGPRRVLPLCLLADQHPQVLEQLRSIRRILKRQPVPRSLPSLFYLPRANGKGTDRLPDYAQTGPVSEFLLSTEEAHRFCGWELERLERQGLLLRSSLTPTDIRVANGRFALGNAEAAKLGLELVARSVGQEEDDFSERVEEQIGRRLCMEAVGLVGDRGDQPLLEVTDRWYGDGCDRLQPVGLQVRVSLTSPVIGAGAPARECLPRAFRHLHTDCLIPQGYEVSVAVGAVVGMVDVTFRAKLIPAAHGAMVYHGISQRRSFETEEEAAAFGRSDLEAAARERLARDHVQRPLFEFHCQRKTVATAGGEEVHLETLLQLRATGRPDLGRG